MECVSLSESGRDGGEQVAELIIRVNVGGVFLHRVLECEDGGILAGLGVDNADAVAVLHGEIYVLEHFFPLTPCAEYSYRDRHPDKYRCERYDDMPDH